ncbi:UDP-galactopyranose mutase [Bathymodiolus platifrons methanotrophic gill symbiont]|uniref:UDP-galactopyranose mutase n=1 Tax=Bathymodiolus platifrons methanotrophic gill symbiont TaxID=113268 RepID=UPI000B415D07|nr:UDP-galactopyranose mutase [Bathymodiolus platifrons methanotrophic gill symbiont]MCK5870286.1 UDP-galactopyranose mutase [Methyloprofundus sp.]TXK95300.1 UDP-galactopyranose mutase [Methylococcaceae bacterium CS4]TXK97023.1 UDP-galactopyranose mutase [Methylococcaceae bacterium CS5]TXL05531.1 UDP-galactopyranose mutase [Methylococcaceae bacterium CS3]TXL08228.1 UDP-galactopyranose mutase [Methylococcaceae bacterium CS1]TXL09786.1 UDP-galactopyranose mutase [Methylococcaceae bacterium CS2]
MYDTIIIGAGFAGAVLAERLATQKNQRVLVIDKRQHIGGNCFDCFDEHGVLIHQYGPHLFHTDNKSVFDYLSQFTEWRPYQHEVLAFIDGQKVPVPFNLNSLHSLLPKSLADSLELKLIERFGYGVKVPILELRTIDDKELKFLADFIYEKIFVNYTAKQWGKKPEDISAEVTGRVPVHISRDNRYFQDKYQAIPAHGYTKIFQNMLDQPNISLLLNTDFKDVFKVDLESGKMQFMNSEFTGQLIFTGLIDELLEHRFGELPYRSLAFKFENLPTEQFQEKTTINYPNDYDFTRITEFKHISQQTISGTTIVKEFPQNFERDNPDKNIPYYPIFTDENKQKLDRYLSFAEQFDNITLVGRLAENRYYDMDDIVARALQVFADEF